MTEGVYDQASQSRESIFYIIFETGASLNSFVDEWIHSYKKSKDSALLHLFQFIVDASGCHGKISELGNDFSDVIRDLTQHFKESSREYPLVQTGCRWKTFKNNLSDFIINLIKRCGNSILYDDYLMPKLISFLASLSDSQVRAFRHTSTFAVMKIMTALCEVYRSMLSKQRTSMRQHETELNKRPERRAEEKLSHLREVLDEVSENLTNLKEMLTYLFKSVFVLRFRDSFSVIRAISIRELGVWLIKVPGLFLDDFHLKYLAWSLNDKVSDVRKCSLISLKRVFETEGHTKMELFLLKCKERIISMTLDVDLSVAVNAVELISLIYDNYPSLFENKEIEGVYQLVFGENAEVAHAAGQFLYKRLLEGVNGRSIQLQSGNKITSNDIIIMEIVEFFIQSELHEHTAYLVDSLLDCCTALEEWDCMTNYLLNDAVSGEAIGDAEEHALIDIMACSVVQVATGSPPVCRRSCKKIRTRKELTHMKSEVEKLTLHFSSVLPALINKFFSNNDNLLNLLKIPLHFDHNLFLNTLQKDNVMSLLKTIQSVFERHNDPDILESCAKIFDQLSHDNYSLCLSCNSFVSILIDEVVKKLISSSMEWTTEAKANLDEDVKFALVSSVKKISALYPFFNLNQWDIWKIIFEIMEQKAIEQALDYPEEYIMHSLTCCYYNLLWDLNSFEEKIESGESGNEILEMFKKKFQSFTRFLEFILKNTTNSCAEEAYKIYCNFLLIFVDKSCKFSKYFEGIISFPSTKLRDLLFSFLEKKIFLSTDENEVGDVFKKRILLSSYCKLYYFRVLPVYFMSDILKYYRNTYSIFGDIFDVTISRAKDLDGVDFARAMINLLMSEFASAKKVQPESNIQNEILILKKLAKKFSSILGSERENDVFLKALHMEGIMFAIKDLNDRQNIIAFNLLFFDLLAEFSCKLNKKNKLILIHYLNGINLPQSDCYTAEMWQPFVNYKNSLLSGSS